MYFTGRAKDIAEPTPKNHLRLEKIYHTIFKINSPVGGILYLEVIIL